ncbi:GNAT family N-acetyltransferase [Streptomyces filamentosus]|uniref:GNAT family N-acetyltransferase n=2 Tax=Streptomyces filamentosus TaxID=67294 RepID=A0ABY4UY76_STRFL|nr:MULTISPECIES: GNAT family protein [Streptomyces]MYR79217.1 GNAT family N-acetyltransferase [Streptomyces sp. SID5466]EFE75137.1 acetyltransferase [Streptomyces filamentosus NRRL 15998]ESU48450.1 acetyltransferase [Streptomyces sp. HCCB10043]EWS92198.1 acetyltransferase [Streptomyces filamentosus NRRL 11379]USC49196.1 GNAT family N-acetyltransferase [Streptomyces filamentosus]
MFVLPLREGAQLRPLEPAHAQEFLEHIDRARPNVDPWIPWATFSTDLESATATLQRYADRQARDTGRLYGIWLDGTLVGGVMFTRFETASGNCEIGCWSEEAGSGQGLVNQACRALIDWAFTERGMSRVEWLVSSVNTRSIAAARRLGLTREGVLRKRTPYRGERLDTEVWSILSEEWQRASTPTTTTDKAELDRLMAAFLGAFDNTVGAHPHVDAIREVFIPQGMIISNTASGPVIHTLDAFIEPREKMLTDGTLTQFSEWEVSERTEIFESIAHRTSAYRKSGVHKGEPFEGAGRKMTQFVRTPAGWKMASLTWEDE